MTTEIKTNFIRDFLMNNTTEVIKHLQLNDIVESPKILLNSLKTSTKESSYKDCILTEYINCNSIKKFANARDVDIVNLLIRFVDDSYDIGKNNSDQLEITNISTTVDEIKKNINSTKGLTSAQEKIIYFVMDLAICSIIKGSNENTL